MITIKFSALKQKNYRISIFLIVLAILIPVAIFMYFVISNHITKLSRSLVVIILGVLGIISFFIIVVFTQVILSKRFELVFNNHDLLIKSEANEIINYSEMASIIIHNNSDYSNITVNKKDGKKIKFFVGMANLLRNNNILQPSNPLDDVLQKHFKKDYKLIKGIEILSYK